MKQVEFAVLPPITHEDLVAVTELVSEFAKNVGNNEETIIHLSNEVVIAVGIMTMTVENHDTVFCGKILKRHDHRLVDLFEDLCIALKV